MVKGSRLDKTYSTDAIMGFNNAVKSDKAKQPTQNSVNDIHKRGRPL